jgi:hypothetical protein
MRSGESEKGIDGKKAEMLSALEPPASRTRPGENCKFNLDNDSSYESIMRIMA